MSRSVGRRALSAVEMRCFARLSRQSIDHDARLALRVMGVWLAASKILESFGAANWAALLVPRVPVRFCFESFGARTSPGKA